MRAHLEIPLSMFDLCRELDVSEQNPCLRCAPTGDGAAVSASSIRGPSGALSNFLQAPADLRH
jgi:hypothetical protein